MRKMPEGGMDQIRSMLGKKTPEKVLSFIDQAAQKGSLDLNREFTTPLNEALDNAAAEIRGMEGLDDRTKIRMEKMLRDPASLAAMKEAYRPQSMNEAYDPKKPQDLRSYAESWVRDRVRGIMENAEVTAAAVAKDQAAEDERAAKITKAREELNRIADRKKEQAVTQHDAEV